MTNDELDRAVAIEVMKEGPFGRSDFCPSTCWRSAGAVVERLGGTGMVMHVSGLARPKVRFETFPRGVSHVLQLIDGSRIYEGSEPDAPILPALCLAALAAARAGALEGKA